MRKPLVLLFLNFFTLSFSAALAQTPNPIPVPAFPPYLKQYVGLLDDQVTRILALNRGVTELQTSKLQRMSQLQLEISQETAKEVVDAMALGIRYQELETIRRQISAEQQKAAREIQTLLNDVQKGRIAALTEVLRQYPTACAAIQYNLMAAFPPSGFPAPGNVALNPWFDTGSFLLPITGSLGRVGCPITVPTPAFRNGDFTGTIPTQP